MEFSRQEYWSGLPFPSPGDIPDPGMEPRSPALQADALPSEPPLSPSVYMAITEKPGVGVEEEVGKEKKDTFLAIKSGIFSVTAKLFQTKQLSK